MDELLKDFKDKISIIEILNTYIIEFGVLTEDEYKPIKVSILNPDDTVTEAELTVGEIMYFTEHSTITIPARPILWKTLMRVKQELDSLVDKIVVGVFQYRWTEYDIYSELNLFAEQIELYAQTELEHTIQTNATLANLLNIKDENKYLCDLKILKRYIHCKIIKK